MRVHHRLPILLGVLVALLACVVIPTIVHSADAANARADQLKADSAFGRVRLPSDFHPWPDTNTIVCPTGLECFYVPKPSTAIAKETLIGVLTRIGAAYDASRSECVTGQYPLRGIGPVIQRCDIFAQLDGLYVAIHLDRYSYCDRRRCSRANEAEIWLLPPFKPSD